MALISRSYADGDLRLLLELEQELWAADSATVEHTFGEIAFWSQRLLRSDWDARLWFEGDALAGWGWLIEATELEAQVRPERPELFGEILSWAQPGRVEVRANNGDAVARLRASGLEHDPAAPWMRCNARTLDGLAEPELSRDTGCARVGRLHRADALPDVRPGSDPGLTRV